MTDSASLIITVTPGIEPRHRGIHGYWLFSKQLPFQLGLCDRIVGKVGIEPTVFTAWVADLQSAAIAAMLTCPNAFPVTEKLPETDETKCEPSTSGTQNGDRHCR